MSGRHFVALSCLACLGLFPVLAQQPRWVQLNNAEVQLYNAGKYKEALPAAQEALRFAEASFGPQDPKVAKSLDNLGMVLAALDKREPAEPLYRRALSINERALGPNNEEVANNLSHLGQLYQKMGRLPEAADLLVRALSTYEKALGPNHPEVSTCAGYLALVYDLQGRYSDAEPLYSRALAIDEKALGPENPGVSIDLTNLGQLYQHQAKYAQAGPLYVRALSIDLKAHGKDSPVVASDLRDLATLYVDQRKYANAEPIFRRALEIDEKALGPDSFDVSKILEKFAAMYEDAGRYSEAEPLYRRALTIRVKVNGPEDPWVAEILGDLAELYYSSGRFGQSVALHRQVLGIRERTLGPSNLAVSRTLTQLAAVLTEVGQYAEAEALYRRALTIDQKTLGPDSPRVARLLNLVGRFYLDQVKLAPAESLFRSALAIHEKVSGQYQLDVAADLSNLSELDQAVGRFADAESALRRALDINEKIQGPNHPDVGMRLLSLGGMLRAQGRYAEAEPLQLRGLKILDNTLGPDHPITREGVLHIALTYLGWNQPEKAEPFFDRHVASLAKEFDSSFAYMSESERLRFLGTLPGAFPVLFSFVAKYHVPRPSLVAKMYDSLLWEKGLIATSAANLRAKILAGKDPQALALFDKLTAKKAQVAAASSASQTDEQGRKSLAQLEQETNDIEKELLRRSNAMAGQKSLSHATWQDVRKALKPGEAAVEFVRFQVHTGQDWTALRAYVALVVTPESTVPKMVVLGDAKELEAAPLANYRADVARARGVSVPTRKQPETTGGSVAAYNAFWKPLEPELGGAKRVYVSTDGVLNQVPMGLFSDAAGKLLLEKYDLRMVNSTRNLLLPPRGPSSRTAVLLGNPQFDLTEPQQRAALSKLKNGNALTASAPVPEPLPATRDARGGQLPPLPATQDEVDAVARTLKNAGWQVAPYTRELALEEVLDGLHSPRVVHLATHGFFLPDQTVARSNTLVSAPSGIEDPMLRSGLFFAGANRARSGAPRAAGLDDGILTAYQSAQLDLEGTELVVLSACETGLGEQQNTEGVFGLPRGLQEAGAESVLMSMWSVPDRETQELMALFYEKWLGGLDKHDALRQAQLQERETVRQRYGKDLPYYWGAFVLIGR